MKEKEPFFSWIKSKGIPYEEFENSLINIDYEDIKPYEDEAKKLFPEYQQFVLWGRENIEPKERVND